MSHAAPVEARLARRLPQLPVLAPMQLQTHSLYEPTSCSVLGCSGGPLPRRPNRAAPRTLELALQTDAHQSCKQAIM